LLYRYILGGYYSIRYQSFEQDDRPEKSFLRFVVLNTAMFQPDYVDYFDKNEIIDQISYVKKKKFLSEIFKLKVRAFI
jgi:hypothetical protein